MKDLVLYRKGAESTIMLVGHTTPNGISTRTEEFFYKDYLVYERLPPPTQGMSTFREWSEYWEAHGRKIIVDRKINGHRAVKK